MRCPFVAWVLVATAVVARPEALPVAGGDVAGLVAAITTANANDEDDVIILEAGSSYDLTVPHTGVTGLPPVTTRITIQGNGATIRRTGTLEFRILEVEDAGDLVLDHVTIERGRLTFPEGTPAAGEGGAGIKVSGGGKLTLMGSTVRNNQCVGSEYCLGGGIFVQDDDSPEVIVVDSEFSKNAAEGSGGGIFLKKANQALHLTRTTVRENVSSVGGGIAADGAAAITITDSAIIGNRAAEFMPNTGAIGGALSDFGGATWTIAGTTISGNSVTADANGGAPANGGGIAAYGPAKVTIVNSTVAGNSIENGGTAPAAGGGLFSRDDATWTLDNVTIAGNSVVTLISAKGNGGGVATLQGTFTLRNSIVHGNTAAKSPDCSASGPASGGSSFTALVLSAGHNLIGNTQGAIGFVATAGDLVGSDPLLGPLADNGGPTATRALLPGSPAIDAGDPAVCQPIDQRGMPRPRGPRCDIGAVEVPSSGVVTTTSTTTTTAVTTTTTRPRPGVSTTTSTVPRFGCEPAAPTFISVDCRLAFLVADVRAADTGKLERRLKAAITAARAFEIKADTLADAGRKKPAKKALKKAIGKLATFGRLLRSLTGKRAIDGPVRASLLDPSESILADMKTLLRTL